MNPKRLVRTARCLVVLVPLVGLEPARGQGPSTETTGVTVGSTATLDLGTEIGVEGRTLRLRLETIEPAGVVALHSHADRLAVAYILRGTLTERRAGGRVAEHHAGKSCAVGTDVTPWEENAASEPLVPVTADVLKGAHSAKRRIPVLRLLASGDTTSSGDAALTPRPARAEPDHTRAALRVL